MAWDLADKEKKRAPAGEYEIELRAGFGSIKVRSAIRARIVR